MSDEAEILKRRALELAKKSHGSGIFLFTDFLGLADQSAISEIYRELNAYRYTKFGGAEGAERIMIRFGDPEELGYELPFPIVTLLISPVSPKFAERLNHRDFLGALMNLGIERSKLGDIVLRDGEAYLFAREEIAEYIKESLTRVRHTDVRVSLAECIPDGEFYRTEPRRIVLNGERVDAVIAKVYNLSRDEAQRLFAGRLVFINGKEISSPSHTPKANDIISVRGYGRMKYIGQESVTKKGKAGVRVDVFV